MKVRVRFFANIQQNAGVDMLMVSLHGRQSCRLSELIAEINRHIDTPLCSYASRKAGEIPVRVCVNGVLIHSVHKTSQPITNGDSVTIFPLLSAG